jgi:hypothetical protein
MCNGVAFKMTRSCRTGPEDCDAEVGAFGLRGADQKGAATTAMEQRDAGQRDALEYPYSVLSHGSQGSAQSG